MVRPAPALVLLAFFALLASCATVDTSTPVTTQEMRQEVADLDTPGRWTRPDAATVVDPQWWSIFGDSELNDLIERAIAGNVDLKLLTHRIDKARQGVKSARTQGIPTFSASAEGSQRLDSTGGVQQSQSGYSASLAVGWEPDLWGKIRQQQEASSAEVRASEADWRAGYLILVREVASAYFRFRQFEEQLGIHARSRTGYQEILAIYERHLDSGRVSRDVVAAQQAEIIRLDREMAEIQRQQTIERNALAELVGAMVGSVDFSAGNLRDRVQLPTVDTGVSANLLERRPDVVAADERLSAAYRIRESTKAARLPSIQLGLSGGLSAVASPTSFFAQFIPRITFPSLDPNTKIRLKVSEIELEEAKDRYLQTVLRAVQEVENAIVNLRSRGQQLDLERERRSLLEQTRRDVGTRLRVGSATQLEVFEANRSLLEAEQLELELYAIALQDTVVLFNGLGGGW